MTTINRFINWNNKQGMQYSLILLWMLAMISLPIMKWSFGQDIIPIAVTLALIVQFGAVFFIMVTHLSWGRTSIIFLLVAVSTWGMEYLGSTTGFPFGDYNYTDVLQPQIGHVPLLIPLAWFMMLPPAWVIAQLITGRKRIIAYILVSALAITAWDLFLDPQMVDWGFWIWKDSSGGYFGIPWSNYAGWLLTGTVVTVLVRPYRFELPEAPLLTVYSIVWFLQSIGLAIFWNQPAPALVGSLSMGILLLLGMWNYRKAILND
ncbi:MAG: carotenoid biosynthesis protein [Chloroflexi bacterium]|nr:MAG: carotenoid biosynthesis protein [Chloroflexota bacterium]